ncbi:MAG: hypothetical protein U9P73_09825 [Candidatus Cloacimonadota bacterium]|nr:hypothetical protein [Candidatus Cloacimonadota bacterium]
MRVLILLLVFLLSFNLMALSHVNSMNSNSDFIENTPNKISVLETNKPYTKSTITNYSIKSDQELNVYNLNGSVKFIGWNKHYIKITAIKKVFRKCCDLNDLHMMLNTINGLTIETINNSDDNRARIDYVINVPKNTLIGDIFSRGKIKLNNLPSDVINNTRRLSDR